MTLADLLDEAAPRLVAGVEAAVSPSKSEVGARRALAHLPGLMRGLVERLRATHTDEATAPTAQPIQLDVAPLVTALRLLKESVYALIDDQKKAVTPREVRLVGDWFSTLAESALTAENRRFADLLDAIPDHLMLHDADGNLIYVNRATAESAKFLTDLERDKLLGRRVVDIVHDQNFGRHIDGLLERVRGGESITEEFLMPNPDGPRWQEHHLRPVYGTDGKVEAIATASRDIHARKKAEARLQLLSKLGALAETMELESVIDAIARLSIPELADWCFIDVVEEGRWRRATVAHHNPARAALAEELLRTEPKLFSPAFAEQAAAGQALLRVELDETTDCDDAAFADVARRLGARSMMIVPLVVLNELIAVAGFVTTPESGRRYGADDLALGEEMARRAAQVIENARLHQRIRRSEARFRVALEHANISVFETDLELRYTWGYNSQLGPPDGGLIGKSASQVVGGDVGADLDRLKRRVLETGEGAGMAFSALVNEQRRHLLVRYEPLRSVGGLVGLTGATVDVTELKEAEEQLARELGFRERMMGILGHDLRNPVSGVLGLAALMRLDPALSEKAREGLALIETSARRMNEMINTLLDFTRLRSLGSLPVAVEELAIDEVARGVVAELEAGHRGRAIEVALRGDLRGRWDPGRVAQMISNLVANALTHGARDSPIEVALAGEGDAVMLSVSNRGAKIPLALVERLFEPFQQGAERHGEGRRGLGLGLYIVREIVRAHGGIINVRSSDDLTTFTVELPRNQAH